MEEELFELDKKKVGYLEAANKWIQDEMWNHPERRPVDLHDVAAFARAYREGVANGLRQAKGELV